MVQKKAARSVFAGKEGDKMVQEVKESQQVILMVKAAFAKITATLTTIDSKKLVVSGARL